MDALSYVWVHCSNQNLILTYFATLRILLKAWGHSLFKGLGKIIIFLKKLNNMNTEVAILVATQNDCSEPIYCYLL